MRRLKSPKELLKELFSLYWSEEYITHQPYMFRLKYERQIDDVNVVMATDQRAESRALRYRLHRPHALPLCSKQKFKTSLFYRKVTVRRQL